MRRSLSASGCAGENALGARLALATCQMFSFLPRWVLRAGWGQSVVALLPEVKAFASLMDISDSQVAGHLEN